MEEIGPNVILLDILHKIWIGFQTISIFEDNIQQAYSIFGLENCKVTNALLTFKMS